MFPPDPKPSSVVILHREDGRLFLVQRPKASRFFPGHHAFPGGALEPEDGDADDPGAYARCAARELHEEVLVEVDPDALVAAGVTVTPPFSPIRYRTQFFLARLPDGAEPEPQAPELAGGAWFTPNEALAAFEAGEIRLPPPVLHVLEEARAHGLDALAHAGTAVRSFPVRFANGLRVLPLEVGTLPPHTHTNCFIVGDEALAVVDPGATGEALTELLDDLDALVADGHALTHVLVTHHHSDHVGGVAAVLDRFDAELACSAETGELMGRTPDLVLEDGHVLTLGAHTVRAIATPGHAPGHLCFHVEASRAVLAGDLVAGIGTVLIEPSEGDMAHYFESLERLATLCDDEGVRLLFPAHGPPAFKPAEKLRATLDHRRAREAKVFAAVEAGAATDEAIAKAAYADTPDAPAQLALWSAQAHLVKLEGEGRVVRGVGGWQAT